MPKTRMALVFVDGVGLGDPDLAENPLRDPELDLLANFHPPGWSPPPGGGRPEALPAVHRDRPLPFGGAVVATDPSLGIPGFPQSATGQTTLFTGVNGAEALGGRHYTGFPTITLKRVLMEHALPKRLVAAGRDSVFLNAFSPVFFELGDAVWDKHLSATTWAHHACGRPFRSFDDLLAGRAVFHDITHETRQSLPPRSPEEAGRAFAAMTAEADFSLFEFFLTDKAGHAQDHDKASHELHKLERFLFAALGSLDLEHTLLVVTSDHGNVEDLRARTHTHNPVPTLVFGPDAAAVATRLDRLEAFTPVLLDLAGAESFIG